MMRSPSGSPACWRGEVVLAGSHDLVAVDRPGELGQRVRQDDERALGVALLGAAIARETNSWDAPRGSPADRQQWLMVLTPLGVLVCVRSAPAPARRPAPRRRRAWRGPASHRPFSKLARQCQREPRARHAERMAERDRAAIRVHDGRHRPAMPSPRSTASAWLANASLSSMASKSDDREAQPRRELLHRRHRPDAHDARRRRRRVAMPSTRARGMQPVLAHRLASEARIKAPAPSLTPEALPAVTVPSGRTIGFSLASVSSVVSARGCSSVVDHDRPAACPPGTSTGTISLGEERRPPAPWPRAAGCAARRRPGRRATPGSPAATFSPVSGMESVP